MNIKLKESKIKQKSAIEITGSKSESNRLLLLQALYPEIKIKNISNSDDSQLMTKALASNDDLIDIHHAGTAMRFLTAYFAIQEEKTITLTGSKRMKERPIKILVDALNNLGAAITYVENEGFPPIIIQGKKLTKNEVSLNADVSSQYISALLLIGSKLENGLKLTLKGKITSVPYINMTLSLLNEIGVETSFTENVITVKANNQKQIAKCNLTVESDWSSASYFYSIVALSHLGTEIQLSSYKKSSLQGDSVLAKIYKNFGVETIFDENKITLKKASEVKAPKIDLDLSNSPDIAQTIAVTAFASGFACDLSGLHTLKIKETDRLKALKTEIQKLGGEVKITNNSLHLSASKEIEKNIKIATYNDHRMAMAFAPLALKTSLEIEDYKVVSKSYPTFWEDLKTLGFKFSTK